MRIAPLAVNHRSIAASYSFSSFLVTWRVCILDVRELGPKWSNFGEESIMNENWQL